MDLPSFMTQTGDNDKGFAQYKKRSFLDDYFLGPNFENPFNTAWFEEMNKKWIKPEMYHVWHRLIHHSVYVMRLQYVVYKRALLSMIIVIVTYITRT